MQRQDEVETRVQICLKCLKEFCAESTVHGVRYIAEPRRHWLERIWWALACTLSVIFCTFVILNLWTKWNLHPVIATFDDKSSSIGTIPFPAVTICPTKKFFSSDIDVGKFYEFAKELDINQSSKPPPEINYFDAIAQSCQHAFGLDEYFIELPQNRSVCEVLNEISPDLDSFIEDGWMYSSTFITNEFERIFTEFGLCYTFNSIKSRDIYTDEITHELLTVQSRNATNWDSEKGYRTQTQTGDVFDYPYRVFGTGTYQTLRIVFRVIFDETHVSCDIADGFRIALHAPGELSVSKDDYLLVGVEENALFYVKPQVTVTSDGLRKYTTHERNCYFKRERKLRFFKSYSQKNCELECLANFTLNACDCVRFYMPRGNDKVCDYYQDECIWHAGVEFESKNRIDECNCLSDCISIKYDVTPSQMVAFKDDSQEYEYKNHTLTARPSQLFIKFKEKVFVPLNRSETATIFDFIASVGGLLGLFMGISVLSIVELTYFFTVRLCLKWRQRSMVHPIAQTWATRMHNVSK